MRDRRSYRQRVHAIAASEGVEITVEKYDGDPRAQIKAIRLTAPDGKIFSYDEKTVVEVWRRDFLAIVTAADMWREVYEAIVGILTVDKHEKMMVSRRKLGGVHG